MKELSEKDREILKVLEPYPQGLFLWQVQKYAHIPTKQYAFYYLKKLTRKGLVIKDGKLYFASNTKNVLPIGQSPKSITSTTPGSPAQAIRIHSLALAFPLRTPLSPAQPAKLGIANARLAGLKNQQSVYFMQEGLNLMLTPQTLIIYTEQLTIPLNASLAQEIAKISLKAYKLALKNEERYKLDLKRLDKDTLMADIMLNHNALTNSEVAKIVLESKEKFEVRDAFGTLRVIVDFSNQIPEYEAVSANYGIQDTAKLRNFTLAVLEGRLDYEKDHELLHGVVEASLANAQQIGQLAEQNAITTKNEITHLPLLEKTNAMLDLILEGKLRLNEEQKRRLRPLSPSQKRLF